MNKSELKQILKPLIKECIKEVIFESGVLSKVVAEVAQGMGGVRIDEEVPKRETGEKKFVSEAANTKRSSDNQKIREYKKKFAEKVSKEAFGGIDLFEGTEPLSSGGTPGSKGNMGPMANIDPSDSGVDISGLVNRNKDTWKALVND